MRILIVGGFGYLGSILTDLLSQEPGYIVDVCDPCIWGNEEVLKVVKHSEIVEESLALVGYDLVIWCCNVDIEEFYFGRKDYIEKNFAFMEFLLNNSKSFINCSSYVNHYENRTDSPMKEHFDRMEKLVASKNEINFITPSLHGPSPRMRWDTTVNEIYLSFFIQHQCIIGDDWLSEIPLANVYTTAIYIRKMIVQKMRFEFNNVYYFEEKMNLATIVPLVKSVMSTANNSETYQIEYLKTDLPFYLKKEYNTVPIFCQKNITKSIEDILTNMRRNNLPDFVSDRYNNRNVISAASIAKRFIETTE